MRDAIASSNVPHGMRQRDDPIRSERPQLREVGRGDQFGAVVLIGLRQHFWKPCRRDDRARISACGERLSGRAAWGLSFAGGRPTRANAL